MKFEARSAYLLERRIKFEEGSDSSSKKEDFGSADGGIVKAKKENKI